LSDEEQLAQAQEAKESPSSTLNVQAQVVGIGVDKIDQISSPDTTLTALCQLAAIRLGVQRAGISLIARQAQYILAESTQTLNLRDTSTSDVSGDTLWMGLTQVSPRSLLPPEGAENRRKCNRMGNLCENTVGLAPARDADIPPCFCVPDLRNDNRFSNAPYVAGPPHLKFYCGTPITTASNYNIGSFWVLDDRLLPGFTPEQKRFFG
jgi:GAF domain-containing protein